MSAPTTPAKVILLPVPLFILELHSERMVDALLALSEAGFKVEYVRGAQNRYKIVDINRIEDAKEIACPQK